MGKKSKIVFNLTIKDLKDLGIIKRRKKSKRRKLKYISNVKSSSDHMMGSVVPMNSTNNLMNENLRLKNKELASTGPALLRIQNEFNDDRLRLNKRLEDYEHNSQLTGHVLRKLYDGSFENSLSKGSGLAPIIEEPDDNIDVPTTKGSDYFTHVGGHPDVNIPWDEEYLKEEEPQPKEQEEEEPLPDAKQEEGEALKEGQKNTYKNSLENIKNWVDIKQLLLIVLIHL